MDKLSVIGGKSKKLAQRFVIVGHWPIFNTTSDQSQCLILMQALRTTNIEHFCEIYIYIVGMHLLGFNFKPGSFNLLSTSARRVKCSMHCLAKDDYIVQVNQAGTPT